MLALRAKTALLVLSLAIGTTTANAFPDRSVRLIVPFPPGGVTDTAARLIGQQLSTKWGQPVVIENRPGAGGVIGVEAAMRSTPDGYTLLIATNGEITIHAAISAKPKFDAQKELVPIAMATTTPFMWAANLNSGIGSLVELVSMAKAKPGSLSYSSAGLGSSSHMATEQLAAAANIKLMHVPYRGGAPAATALMSGEVPISAIALSSVRRCCRLSIPARSSFSQSLPTSAQASRLRFRRSTRPAC
jgi:tripartite-type tricarboxylate transporter receptor subunit TctC